MRVWLVATVMCSFVAGGCAFHPTVTLINNSQEEITGYVQIPSRVVVGYPAPSSRCRVTLPPGGTTTTFTYSDGNDDLINYYVDDVFVLLHVPRNSEWTLVTIDARKGGAVRLSLSSEADGRLEAQRQDGGPVKIESVSQPAGLDKMGSHKQ